MAEDPLVDSDGLVPGFRYVVREFIDRYSPEVNHPPS